MGKKREKDKQLVLLFQNQQKQQPQKKYKVQEYIRNIYVNGSNNDNNNTVKVSCATNHCKIVIK